MKIKYYDTLIAPLVKLAKDDGDAICAVFFSRQEDKFSGAFEGMNEEDALMVIKVLIEQFEIAPSTLRAEIP
jgi:hypothetical protein